MKQTPFKDPQIRDRGGDMQKRWYIQFWYFSKSEQKFVSDRIGSIPGIITPNREKDKAERYRIFAELKEALKMLLKAGWTPEDKVDASFINQTVLGKGKEQKITSLEDALKLVYRINPRLEEKGTDFLAWMETKGLNRVDVTSIKRATITEYLRHVLATKGKNDQPASPTTRNNYLVDLHTMFEIMMVEDLIMKNPTKGIERLKAVVERHVAYSPAQMLEIGKWCDENKPYLKDFIHFIGYAYLRPVEILRIQAKEVDLEQGVIFLNAKKGKTLTSKTILIIDRLRPTVEKIMSQVKDPNDYLFTTKKRPGPKQVYETTWFSKQFVECRKALNEQHNYGLTINHTLYATRHTFIQDLWRHFRYEQKLSIHEAEDRLMPITRHNSRDSLRKYIRDYSFELPKDWGGGHSFEF